MNMPAPCKPAATQRGAAVILAMLIVALAAMAASSFLFRAQIEWRKLENANGAGQARWVLRAAEQWAGAVLRDDARQNSVDHLGEVWAKELPPIEAEGHRIAGHIADLDGRFNINNLVNKGNAVPAQMAIFKRLLSALRLPDDLAENIVDWLDSDDRLQGAPSAQGSESGTESSYYLGLPQPRRAPNRAILHLNELLQVKNMTPAYLDELRPFVSTVPGMTQINVNTASAEVLSALIEGLTLSDAYGLAAKRDRAYFRNIGDLRQALPEWVSAPENLLGFTSRYFLVTARIRHDRIALGSRALLERDGKQFPTLIWRAAL